MIPVRDAEEVGARTFAVDSSRRRGHRDTMILESKAMRLELLRTKGDVLEMLATYQPGSPPPPLHFHPKQREIFAVRRGALCFRVDGRERVVTAGESITIEPRQVHSVRNVSPLEPAEAHWETRPALRSAQLFQALHHVQTHGMRPLEMSAILHEFRAEFALAAPPRCVQTCVLAFLGPLARSLGHAPHYTE